MQSPYTVWLKATKIRYRFEPWNWFEAVSLRVWWDKLFVICTLFDWTMCYTHMLMIYILKSPPKTMFATHSYKFFTNFNHHVVPNRLWQAQKEHTAGWQICKLNIYINNVGLVAYQCIWFTLVFHIVTLQYNFLNSGVVYLVCLEFWSVPRFWNHFNHVPWLDCDRSIPFWIHLTGKFHFRLGPETFHFWGDHTPLKDKMEIFL